MSDIESGPSDGGKVRWITPLAKFQETLGQVHYLNNNGYHTGEQFRTALNTHVGVENWSFRIIEHGYDQMGDEFWVLGELQAILWLLDPDGDVVIPRTVIKQAFGGQNVKRRKSDGMPLSPADDRKGAATDALKKAAMDLGFGLALSAKNPAGDLPYRRGEDDPDLRQRPAPVPTPGATNGVRSGPSPVSRPAPKAPVNPASPEEISTYEFVRAEAVQAGFTAPWLEERAEGWTGPQLKGYQGQLERYLAKQQEGARAS